MVCEMRFFVPSVAPVGKKEDPKAGEEKKAEEEHPEGEEGKEEEVTPAQQLYQDIIKKANIGTFADEAIVTLPELPMITPRGKYSLDMYQTYLKFHGRTHNFKILYRNINKAFALPKPDGQHIAFVIALTTPIKQGQTYYPFIVLQFHKETKEHVKANLSTEQLKQSFDGKLEAEIDGLLHDVLSKLFATMIKIKIIVPSDFKSAKEAPAIRCSVRAFEGHLYPLEKALLFVNKPVVHIRLTDIQYVEFARVSQTATQTNRSFDLNVYTKNGETHQFTGMERNEYSPLLQYIQNKKIKIQNLEPEMPTGTVLKSELVFLVGSQTNRARWRTTSPRTRTTRSRRYDTSANRDREATKRTRKRATMKARMMRRMKTSRARRKKEVTARPRKRRSRRRRRLRLSPRPRSLRGRRPMSRQRPRKPAIPEIIFIVIKLLQPNSPSH